LTADLAGAAAAAPVLSGRGLAEDPWSAGTFDLRWPPRRSIRRPNRAAVRATRSSSPSTNR
jgi:hypothetical protein